MIRLMDLINEGKENRIIMGKLDNLIPRVAEIVSETQKSALLVVYATLKLQVEEINNIRYTRATQELIADKIKETVGTLASLHDLVLESKVDEEVLDNYNLIKATLKAINEIYEY